LFIFSDSNLVRITAAKVIFSSWKIQNNNVSSPLLLFSQVSGYLSSIKITNNSDFKAFDFYNCDIVISDFRVSNDENYNQKLGFFSYSSTNLNLTNGNIENNYLINIATLTEGNSFFENVTFSNSLGQVLFLILSNLKLKNCHFWNNTSIDPSKSSDIYFINSRNYLFLMEIVNCTFDIFSHYSLYFEGLINITINSSSFHNNLKSNKSETFGIYAFNFYSLSINSSDFSNFTDSSIKIYTDKYNFALFSTFIIQKSIFYNNIAKIGSSLYISGNLEIFINNCKFSQNYAYISNKNDTTLTGVAPAVFFKPLNNSLCKINITSCSFMNNIAEYIAPTIFSQMEVTYDDHNSFSNNQYFYGVNFTKNFFSYPLSLQVERKISNISPDFSINLVSGQPINLTFQIIDYFGQVLTFDNSTILMIKNQDRNKQIYLENNIAIASDGNVEFRNLIIKTQSNTNFSLLIEGVFLKITQDLKSEVKPENIQNIFPFTIRKCLFGEIILNDSTCFKCKENTYSLINPMKIEIKYQRCLPCPLNSYCLGGSFITPLAGYYRKSFTSTNVVECFAHKSCLGFIETTNFTDPSLINGACQPGSFGPVCFYCDPIYGKYNNRDSCSYCDVISELVYVRMFLTIVFILLQIMISVSQIEKYNEKTRDRDIFSIGTKIIINHSQHIMLIVRNSLALPDFSVFKDFFYSFDYISFINIGSFMNECFIHSFFYNPQKFIIYLSLYSTLIPLFFALLAFVIWMIVLFLYRFIKAKSIKEQFKNWHRTFLFKYLIYLLITAYMFYPLILKSSFTLLDCFKLDLSENITYLRESPEVQCWGSEHLKYVILYALPGIIIWGISFPIVLFVILRKNHKTIVNNKNLSQSIKNKKIFEQEHSLQLKAVCPNAGSTPLKDSKTILSEKNAKSFNEKAQPTKKNEFTLTIEKNKSIKNLNILGYFYCGYRSKLYYWESLIFFRKFFLALILTLDQKIEEESKWIIVISILLASLFMTLKHKPYKIKFINKLESFSLITCIFSSFISALAVADGDGVFKSIVNITCLVFNLGFFISTVLFILYDFTLKIKEKMLKFKEYALSRFTNKMSNKVKIFERSVKPNKK